MKAKPISSPTSAGPSVRPKKSSTTPVRKPKQPNIASGQLAFRRFACQAGLAARRRSGSLTLIRPARGETPLRTRRLTLTRTTLPRWNQPAPHVKNGEYGSAIALPYFISPTPKPMPARPRPMPAIPKKAPTPVAAAIRPAIPMIMLAAPATMANQAPKQERKSAPIGSMKFVGLFPAYKYRCAPG